VSKKDRRTEADELWAKIRDAVKRLDELADEKALEDGELYEDEIPDGQMLGNLAIAYSVTYIEDGEVEFMTTYLTAPGSAPEVAVGLFQLAEKQVLKDCLDES
jgi:hypothetical protein